ncbi:DNA-directed RNA polymerase I subunit RPA12-like [Panicum miliaceum]|uniref:DNA-directed RNA polymerase subunit n=1 Tax=Panicum miliaceum TaxID=4540 RepID=A0A3L6SFG0_PANMI|nr:DNA-directed RNA polymerase I subunit RPA12-like [Panicum miliaceum]
MAFWQARDFLFCGVCGSLVTFDSVRSASCPLCGFKRKAKEIEGKETRYTVTAEDIRRELKIDPFEEVLVRRPVTSKTCPKCNHSKAEYYSRQMRSVDEGETTFYECTECRHKFKEN